jgi:glutamate-1-semialdehyde 2,1-aminomutase
LSEEKVSKSEGKWRERARSVLLTPEPNRHGYPTEAPWFFGHGSGQRLYTVGGAYLDLLMARGTSVLGYNHPDVTSAVLAHATSGFLTSLRHHAEVEVAELIVEHVPSAEKVMFAKNGSDACTFAIRAARAATGRATVLSSGFHGFGDVFNAGPFAGNGFPSTPQPYFIPFEVNDTEEFATKVSATAHDLAAIIIDPMNRDLATPQFLRLARAAACETGAVLIFDEVVTGFRVHLGGAQALTGVTPDLTCLGKVMGNGYPLSALTGRADILGALTRTSFTSTFQTDSLAMVVGEACLRRIIADDVPTGLSALGERMRRLFDDAAAAANVPARAVGVASRLELVFSETAGCGRRAAERIFQDALAAAGVIPTLAIYVSIALTEEDLAQAKKAFDDGMAAVAEASSGFREDSPG